MPKKKIDFVISSLTHGGAERVLVLMANSLARNINNEVSVIVLYKANESYTLNSAVKRIQLKQSRFIPTFTLDSIINLTTYYRIKSRRPDFLISFLTTTNFIAIIVAKVFSIKIIAQEHISYFGSIQDNGFITKITRKYLYKMADKVTVLTYNDVSGYKKLGVDVCVMPNPCSFKPITDNSHPRDKIILAVGNLDRHHHKGFDNLISIMAPILEEYPDWQLKIAGSGEIGLKYLTELAKEKNILEKIIFTGFINNISEVMHQSSIFILPSRFEGLPMVLLEAMSQGMACIAYNCKTGPSDIIENNKNGLLIDDQNIAKMQGGLRKLLMSENLRLRLSNEGVKSLDKYDVLAITKRYEALFEKIMTAK
ncbi:glycosyltransferase family 4 protein [Gelidibacter maritimus]|uniref:Glycosyltransferase family 4 protein n=1 Tax=Gelidibacter maritimus TaxID=2761487 RepID=A0A7W2M6H9_9FLAO|nr:glycosyltransferase family 4 protein [Gelidibacter maritimus]MBA6153573.1 glycosyltransferase family 4 protein [Gelidibacter maritimus]